MKTLGIINPADILDMPAPVSVTRADLERLRAARGALIDAIEKMQAVRSVLASQAVRARPVRCLELLTAERLASGYIYLIELLEEEIKRAQEVVQ